MAFVAIYDACVLYPNSVRDLLVRLAMKGLLRARWTERILDECFRSILKQRPDLTPDNLARTRQLMTEAVADCMVTGFEDLIPSLSLPDPDDRHVLAAAIRSGAQMIVTFNLKDFPDDALEKYGIEAQHPDDFVLNQIHLNSGAVVGTVIQQAERLKKNPHTPLELLDVLARNGLVESADELRRLLPR